MTFNLNSLFFYLLLFLLILFILILIPQYRSLNNEVYSGELEKTSAFECGFNMMKKNFQGFSITFLKVAILFLLVDLEIALLIPLFNKSGLLLKKTFPMLSTVSLISVFLIFLLFIEKKSGGLNWKEVN
nr:NADH dehydrogenase subunit 3 [Heterochaerus australis]